MNMLTAGLHFGIPDEAYRADPGLNQSVIKAFGTAKSPAHFTYEQANPPDPNHPSRAGLRIGGFVDARLFRDAKFLGEKFAHWRGERKGNAWAAFKEQNTGSLMLNGDEHDRAHGALAALAAHDDTQRILKVCNTQVVAIAEHPRLKLRMKGLIDLLPDPLRCDPLLLEYAFDLKTAADASPEGFAKACYEFGYDIQAAFYSDILSFLGGNVKTFGFIVVENKPPHLVKIHYLTLDSQIIRRARQRYEDWMLAYSNCIKLNDWPGYTSGWTEIQYKPWMLRDEGYVGDSLE